MTKCCGLKGAPVPLWVLTEIICRRYYDPALSGTRKSANFSDVAINFGETKPFSVYLSSGVVLFVYDSGA